MYINVSVIHLVSAEYNERNVLSYVLHIHAYITAFLHAELIRFQSDISFVITDSK